jgi:tRNA modification GTPase
LLVLDATAEGLTQEELALLEEMRTRRALLVVNKMDLAHGKSATEVVSLAEGTAGAIKTSALTGEGISQLRDAILTLIRGDGKELETGLMTNLRQQQAVSETLQALQDGEQANHAMVPHEMLLMDLHSALRSLDALTGATTIDDILNLIFSTFCIGK